MPSLKLALAATRPRFLAASLLPVLLGTAWGWRASGALDAPAAGLALLATALVHAASNAWNDVGDEVHGSDRANTAPLTPFTGGSRLIQQGALTLAGMRAIALALASLAATCGALLAWRNGAGVIAFGIAGGALGAAYSSPGLRLSDRGLGELAIALAFGALPVGGAAWLQGARLDAALLLLSLPVSAWIAAVILANEVPDTPADAAAGKLTLAVRLGRRTPLLYLLLQAVAFAGCVALVLAGLLPRWSLVVPLALLAPALAVVRLLGGGRDELARGIRLTLAIHAIGCLWLTGAVAIRG